MQNPGSDAGVFVWADGADGLSCAVNARCNVTLKNSQRPAEDKTSRSLKYPCYTHRSAKYTMVCVDNFKKYFSRESQTEPTVRLSVVQSNVAAGSRLTQKSD
jgi:hypothetical protein